MARGGKKQTLTKKLLKTMIKGFTTAGTKGGYRSHRSTEGKFKWVTNIPLCLQSNYFLHYTQQNNQLSYFLVKNNAISLG